MNAPVTGRTVRGSGADSAQIVFAQRTPGALGQVAERQIADRHADQAQGRDVERREQPADVPVAALSLIHI